MNQSNNMHSCFKSNSNNLAKSNKKIKKAIKTQIFKAIAIQSKLKNPITGSRHNHDSQKVAVVLQQYSPFMALQNICLWTNF